MTPNDKASDQLLLLESSQVNLPPLECENLKLVVALECVIGPVCNPKVF